MRVTINRDSPYIYEKGNYVKPLSYDAEVIVAIDPSKTNTGIIIGNPVGDVLSILQFSGTGQETENFLVDFKDFLKHYLSRCKVVCVAMEESITKKGMNYHKSTMVLTQIRGVLIDFFLDFYDIQVRLVNNYSWKSAILPKEFIKVGEKGSFKYLQKEYGQYTHDVTDAVCIFRYALKSWFKDYVFQCTIAEKEKYNFKFIIVPVEYITQVEGVTPFMYNHTFSFRENMNYYINRSPKVGVTAVTPNVIPITDIYGHAKYFKNVPKEVGVICSRL